MALPLHAQVSGGRIPVFINTRGVESNAELQRIVRANIRTALGRFGRSVRSVFVWIDDTNGPRDGSGRRCRMEVALASEVRFASARRRRMSLRLWPNAVFGLDRSCAGASTSAGARRGM